MRLIDADAINIHDISPVYGFVVMGITEEDIDFEPTIEPPTTTWLGSYSPYTCEKCGYHVDSKTRYCPDCGRRAATMKDELDEFMTALEDIGVLTGWTEFMHGDDEKEKEDTTDD